MEHVLENARLIAETRTEPPRWAVTAVKLCVAGILIVPLGTPVLLVASSAMGPQGDTFRPIAFAVSILLWVAMFAVAQALTTHYPPVPKRRR